MYPRQFIYTFVLLARFLSRMAEAFAGVESGRGCAFKYNEALKRRKRVRRRCAIDAEGSLHDTFLRSVLFKANLIPSSRTLFELCEDGLEVYPLSNGFCNRVYKVNLPYGNSDVGNTSVSDYNTVVVKVYSPMAKVRLQAEYLGLGDIVASDSGVGPKLIYRGEDGLVMQYVNGKVLSHVDISGHANDGFGDGRLLCELIAKKVAQLHKDELPLGGERIANMLWHSIQNMISYIGSNEAIPSSVRAKGWSYEDLCRETRQIQAELDSLDLSTVLGHNDLKPANIMVSKTKWTGAEAEAFDITLIDLELTGYAPRGYDICKLFRTSDKTDSTLSNRKSFAKTYLMAVTGDDQVSIQSIKNLLLEADLFEPLTWLEAGIFFLFAAKGDPGQMQRWEGLAIDRLQNYMMRKDEFRTNVAKWRRGGNTLLTSKL
mmetsp:Transcript_44380/g.135280  ORF Transcript_44380/g.135280 Transcript_44380/m.135280 type:complete len:430 (-) Transcript_44380:164-1453(-)